MSTITGVADHISYGKDHKSSIPAVSLDLCNASRISRGHVKAAPLSGESAILRRVIGDECR